MAKYYSVYDSKTETMIAFGTSKECAEKLGIKVESFYYAISRQNRGVGKRKYSIIGEKLESSDRGREVEEYDY